MSQACRMSGVNHWILVLLGSVAMATPMRGEPLCPQEATEPNFEIADAWWPPLENIYTPIGWKNHLFRFNVFYNGVVMAKTQPEEDVKLLDPWADLGVQLSIQPSEKGLDPDRWRSGTYQMTTDNGRRWTYQGMLDHPTPVVWNEWRSGYRTTVGYVLREEVFAHMPGGRPIETGQEPLFAWIRMSIQNVNPIMDPEPCYLMARINKPHVYWEMYTQRHCALRRTDALYPRELDFEQIGEGAHPGCLIVEEGDRVRVGVLPGGGATKVWLEKPKGDEQDTNLHIILPVEKGNYVDLLLPMLPAERDVFLEEMSLGRDGALAESDAYWSDLPVTAATIDTPEPWVNEFIRRSPQYGQITAQKMPDTGHLTNLTGSLVYARMWPTPTTTYHTMLLDALGYHGAVDQYMEILRDTQGEVKPPGPNYDRHPGYLGGPANLGLVSWLTDHGAILHAACNHALVTNDRAFIERWHEPIIRACEWIRDACAITGHDGVPGLPPPGTESDRHIPTQALWNLGWQYLGLTSAVELLERLDDPRAGEFARLAEDYRERTIAALREATAKSPTWTDRDGDKHHIVPMSLSPGGDVTHHFYLDTGPLAMVYTKLLPADDPLMKSTMEFFREGPNWSTFDPHGSFEQPAVLVREISSCEPCYSWSFFHSHQLKDRQKYLEAMYALLTGAHSRKTFVQCETRGGITGIPGVQGVYLIRLCVVDDLIEDDALHLLRLTPKAWLKTDHRTRFVNIPTLYGPVKVTFQLADGGKTLDVEWGADFHHSPEKVLLHVPPVDRIERVRVNGKAIQATGNEIIPVDRVK